jgi:hypothetical protein
MIEKTYIEVEEIETIYREHCEDIGVKFSKNGFARFLEFLKIDFFDWVNGNLKYFDKY